MWSLFVANAVDGMHDDITRSDERATRCSLLQVLKKREQRVTVITFGHAKQLVSEPT